MLDYSAPLKPIVINQSDDIQIYDPKEIDPQAYLSIYRTQPSTISPQYMDAIQARIVLGNDFMLNPNANVHIYRYTTVPAENMAAYQKELQVIIDEIMHTWSLGECSSLGLV